MTELEDTAPAERRLRGAFEQYEEFLAWQEEFLAVDLFKEPTSEEDENERTLGTKLNMTLATYQEQAYLLDPYLEELVVPVVDSLKAYARRAVSGAHGQGSRWRVWRLSSHLQNYMKFRGYKAIIRYFPHEVADLSIALDFMTLPDGFTSDSVQWQLRYVVLVWLSLICMIPFDLARFDERGESGRTASRIENVAKPLLQKAGLERDGAALLLTRLYMRQDMELRFLSFLESSIADLRNDIDLLTTLGYLQIFCYVAQDAPTRLVRSVVEPMFEASRAVEASEKLLANTLVRKFRVKLISRLTLRLLPTASRARAKGRALDGKESTQTGPLMDEDVEIPEQTETVLEQLFEALQDRDTIVRWSASKAVARISEALPSDFAEQILEQVLQLFTIHSIASAALYDLPAIAEATWHGACLACAELARRGLVSPAKLSDLMGWLYKALYFDIRKGSHSIGSNVRDATAYVFWALARSQEPSVLEPHATDLARHLVSVAVFDREIHIRRAASAAFQEHVGRNSLLPHGIKVLGITDFFSVSVRRNAFLVAAPQVAELPEYRENLLSHLLNVTIRHWDPSMRELAAKSVGRLCATDIRALGPAAFQNLTKLLDSIDPMDLHGGLLALSELAGTYEALGLEDTVKTKQEIFACLKKVSLDIGLSSRNTIVTAAMCKLISTTLTDKELDPQTTSVPTWRRILDSGIKNRSPEVQEAAGLAMGSLSKRFDYLRAAAPAIQQSLGTLLASIDYSVFPTGLPLALNALFGAVKMPSKLCVEARRNCYSAFPRIVASVPGDLPRFLSAGDISTVTETLLAGLNDYSTDQRGDVGSWIRMACLRALSEISCTLITSASVDEQLEEYLPPSKLHDTVGRMLKQGVERLDNVRQEAWISISNIYKLPRPEVKNATAWDLPGSERLKEVFDAEVAEDRDWTDGTWLFPKAIRLLDIPEYRSPLLAGTILSLGTKTESTQRPLAASFVEYVSGLPPTSNGEFYSVQNLLEELHDRIESGLTNNAIAIPVLQTLTVLLEGGAFASSMTDDGCAQSLQKLLAIATRGVTRFKSVPRIMESMKISVNMMILRNASNTADKLPLFLQHPFPNVRKDTAEYLYMALQGADMEIDTDEAEETLLETEWLSTDDVIIKDATNKIVKTFKTS